MNTSEHGRDQASLQAAEDGGRDARGRFAKGNLGGPGNPFARKVAALRTALIASVSEEDMRAIAEQLVVSARLGDLAAIKLLFQYVLGKPAAAVDPDTLDLQELELYKRGPSPQEMQEVVRGRLPAAAMAEVLRVAMPCAGVGFQAAVARGVLGGDWDEGDEGDECEAEDRPAGDGAGARRRRMAAAPSPNGEVADDPRQVRTGATPCERMPACGTNGPGKCDGDHECRSAGVAGRSPRPPCGAWDGGPVSA